MDRDEPPYRYSCRRLAQSFGGCDILKVHVELARLVETRADGFWDFDDIVVGSRQRTKRATFARKIFKLDIISDSRAAFTCLCHYDAFYRSACCGKELLLGEHHAKRRIFGIVLDYRRVAKFLEPSIPRYLEGMRKCRLIMRTHPCDHVRGGRGVRGARRSSEDRAECSSQKQEGLHCCCSTTCLAALCATRPNV